MTAVPPSPHDPTGSRTWVVIQRNPTSGTGWRRSLLVELVQELRRLGLRPRMFHNRSRCDQWLADPEHQQCHGPRRRCHHGHPGYRHRLSRSLASHCLP